MFVARPLSARFGPTRAFVCALTLLTAGGCENLGRSEQEFAALRVAKDEELSDEDALIKITAECVDKFATAKVSNGDGGATLTVISSISGWSGGSLDSFKTGVRRRLGERALCIHLAGEQRSLETLRIVHILAETKLVLYTS